MLQVGDSACLFEKIAHVIVSQPHIEHFDGSLGIEMNVFAEINISKASSTEQVDQAVVSKLLANTSPGEVPFPVLHLTPPLSDITPYSRHAPFHHGQPTRCACHWETTLRCLPL